MSTFTAELATFVSGLRLEHVPSEGQSVAKTGITDCFGVMIAGAREPVVELLDRELAGSDGRELASLIPSKKMRDVEDAALVNAAAAHILDYDDVTLDGHPSAVLAPTILAQGEALGRSGSDILTAYIAGYEVWAELLVREPVPLYQKGWHPTAIRGAIAAAAACAHLRRLNSEKTQSALAIAASMTGGLVANFGTLTKSFQVGRAAQSGILAARLAEAGLTASADALEHQSGFFVAFSPTGKFDLSKHLAPAKKEWYIVTQGLNLKRYPVCYATHRAIDAALHLTIEHDLEAGDIDQINVLSGEMQMRMLRNGRPKTAIEAKFSMEFAMASSVVARNVGLSELTDQFVTSRVVQDLIRRVSISTTTETMKGSAFAAFEAVAITTKGGEILSSGPVVHAKGSAQFPLSREELLQKFVDCLGNEFHADSKSAVFERLMALDHVKSIGDLLSLQ
jgi:2-methylcitrate dehydratase PrpD